MPKISITPSTVREAFVSKGLTPMQGSFNLRINYEAEGGPEFECIDSCGCAISALVHGEKLNEEDLGAVQYWERNEATAASAAASAAQVHVGINERFNTETKSVEGTDDYWSFYENFDGKDSPLWRAVRDLAKPGC